jgi:3-isopropylmalate/(R)-2-methylmalate dehydratase small subunit
LVLEDTSDIKNGDELEVDIKAGKIVNVTSQKTYTVAPLPPFVMEIISDGGLIPHLKKVLSHGR